MELIVTMDIGLLIAPAGRDAAPPDSSLAVDKGQVTQSARDETFPSLFEGLVQNGPVEAVTSNTEIVVPSAGSLTASLSWNALVEKGQVTQPAQSVAGEEGVFSSESEEATALSQSVDAENQAASVFVIEDPLAMRSAVIDPQAISIAEVDRTDFAQNAQRFSLLGVELSPLVAQNAHVSETHEAGVAGEVSAGTVAAQSAMTNLPRHSTLPLAAGRGQSGDALAVPPNQPALQITKAFPSQSGRSTPIDRTPAPVEQSSGNPILSGMPLLDSLVADQSPSRDMENQEPLNGLFVAAVVDRLSTGVQPSAKVQAQGSQEITLPGQSAPVPVMDQNGEGGNDPFGADAQGTGEETFFHSRENGISESVTRGNQSTFFSGQFTSAQQAQSSSTTSFGAIQPEDHLKMMQALFEEDRSAARTATTFGRAQIVHMDLPFHDSGPLSVRISMTDQTVHTQFTTDRNELGSLLMGRQDQLQHTLTKAGLELGQFQVHIDQQGRQEAFPDRQSGRNGDASEQQPVSQEHPQHPQDREQLNRRPARGLSLFA